MTDQKPKSGHVFNLRKPIGWTSNDVVRYVKHRTDAKVGHAGTLDPFADGVLLICLGAATKQVPQLMGLEKEYRTTLELGIETDTLDISGVITRQAGPFLGGEKELEQVIPQFIGNIEQIPPVFSALRVDGKRAYQLARDGVEVVMKSRRVTIHDIEALSVVDATIQLRIVCSKGTYIRSLARDIAHALGTIGYLRRLTRTRVGGYTLDDADPITRLDRRLSTY